MLNKLFNRNRDISNVELIFLSKDDCHLCDDALAVVQKVRRRFPFRLRVVKIEEGDEWYEQYWDKIPVGIVDGAMIFKYHVEPDELLRKLRARAREN